MTSHTGNTFSSGSVWFAGGLADEHAAIQASNECFLEKGGEPGPCGEPAFHVLQLCKDSPGAKGHACDGGGDFGSCVVGGGNCEVAGLIP